MPHYYSNVNESVYYLLFHLESITIHINNQNSILFFNVFLFLWQFLNELFTPTMVKQQNKLTHT